MLYMDLRFLLVSLQFHLPEAFSDFHLNKDQPPQRQMEAHQVLLTFISYILLVSFIHEEKFKLKSVFVNGYYFILLLIIYSFTLSA